jgi:hypothetical protein
MRIRCPWANSAEIAAEPGLGVAKPVASGYRAGGAEGYEPQLLRALEDKGYIQRDLKRQGFVVGPTLADLC